MYCFNIFVAYDTLYLLRLAMNCLPAQLFFSTLGLLSCKVDMMANLASSFLNPLSTYFTVVRLLKHFFKLFDYAIGPRCKGQQK